MISGSLLLAASRRSTLLDGLVGYWPLNGGPNDADGLYSSVFEGTGGSWGAGKIGQALHGTGGTARVRVLNSAALHPTGGLTIGGWFWFNAAQSANTRCGTDYVQTGGASRWIFPRCETATVSFYAGINVAAGVIGTTIPANTWVHLLATGTFIANTNTAISVHRDGAVVSTGRAYSLDTAGANAICIGKQTDIGDGINGRICEFSLWNRPLIAAEVAEWFNAGAGKTHPF